MLKLRSIGINDYRVLLEGRQRIGRIRLAEERIPPVWLWAVTIRPATGQDPVTAIRLSKEMRAAVGAWAEAHDLGRSEAIRRLVELGLKSKAK